MAGWTLYRHFEAMSSRLFAYKPPVTFQAMAQVPPPFLPMGASRIQNKLVFPDDKLRSLMEKHSEHARVLAREGLSPMSGQWFTRRPIDYALVRVKNIMREKQLGAKEAILLWDKEYGLELKLQEQEKQLLAEDAVNSGKAISVYDGLNILKLIRDMQAEALLKRKKAVDIAVANIKKEKDARRQYMTPQEQKLAEMTEKMSLDKLRNTSDIAISEAKHLFDVEVDLDRLIDLDTLQYTYLQLEKRLNSSHLRKIAEAKAIKETLIEIRDIKLEFAPLEAYSIGNIVSPVDFLGTFIKAFEINKVPATSPDWGKDRKQYQNAYIDGVKVYDILKGKYELFKEQFKRFMRMQLIHLEVSQILSQIGLAHDQANQEKDYSLEKLLHELVAPVDFTEAINSLAKYNWKDYHKMVAYKPYMEELFFLLDLSYYLNGKYVDRYKDLHGRIRIQG